MDPNQDILENDPQAPVTEADPWPGVPEDARTKVRFPGEDGGKSLSEIAQRDLDAALQLLAERAQYITGATGAAIALGTSEAMVCRASAGSSAPEVGSALQVSSGLSGESVRTRRLLKCDDAQTDGRVNRESCEALGIASVVVMPMVDCGEVIGVFELFSDRAHAFQDRDIDALERMGSMVRTALEQAADPSAPVTKDENDDEVVIEDEPVIASPPKVELIAAPEAAEKAEDDDAVVLEEPTVESDVEPTPLFIAGNVSAPKVSQENADPGEMFRDAAERTAAAKASLFEADGLGETEDAKPGRFAFHMRVPAKAPEVAAEAESKIEAVEQAAEAWSAPKIEENEKSVIAETPTDTPVIVPGVAVTTSGAATAPAREKTEEADRATAASETPALSPVVADEKAAEGAKEPASTSKTSNPVEPAKATPVAKPIARPASPEGRSKIAVSQLRKCEACGFPISEGRRYCLDCEKKPNKPAPLPEAKAVVSQVPAPAEAPSEPKPAGNPMPAAAAQPAPESMATIGANEPPPTETTSPAALEQVKPAIPKTEAKTEAAKPDTVEEPPMPHFMVTPPDQYESWIVSHMYSAVAIAIVIVGIIVYLLSS